MSRLIRVLLAIVLIGIAILLIGPVAATVFTPGWVETADARDWASMVFFLSVAAVVLLVAARVGFSRARSAYGRLHSSDWWVIAVLSVVGALSAAIASHWTIALPGLIPIGVAIALARRRARQERLVLVESELNAQGPRTA